MAKKRIVLLMAMVLVSCLVLAACGGGSGGGGGGGGGSDGVVKIGVNYELSGAVASYGQDSVDGIKMAVDEVNDAGGVLGKQVELQIEDDKSDPAEATSIAEKLLSQDGISAALGPATSGNFRAVIPIAQNYGVPVLSSSATADEDITVDKDGNVRDFVFRTCFTDSFQGRVMADFASSELGAKSAIIFGDTASDYAKGLASNFKAFFEGQDGTIVSEEGYVAGDKDFNSVLTKIKGQDFDVLFVPGYYQEAGLIIKQARELGITQPILGADGFDSPELSEIAGPENVNEVYFSNHYSSLDESAAVQKFIEDFKAANGGKAPSAFHAMGYDLGKYICDTIARAGSADSGDVAAALASTSDWSGVTGSFSVGDDHNVIKSAVVIKLENGEQVSAIRV
ncbi:MAG: ABC transporter substrate-binding protein [Clostridiales bacterium]|nr:ABC transporter substrate-binding protein [Clostridiales bacterium]